MTWRVADNTLKFPTEGGFKFSQTDSVGIIPEFFPEKSMDWNLQYFCQRVFNPTQMGESERN